MEIYLTLFPTLYSKIFIHYRPPACRPIFHPSDLPAPGKGANTANPHNCVIQFLIAYIVLYYTYYILVL